MSDHTTNPLFCIMVYLILITASPESKEIQCIKLNHLPRRHSKYATHAPTGAHDPFPPNKIVSPPDAPYPVLTCDEYL